MMMQEMLTRIVPLDQRPGYGHEAHTTLMGGAPGALHFVAAVLIMDGMFCGYLEVTDKTFCLVDVDTRKDVDIAGVEIGRG